MVMALNKMPALSDYGAIIAQFLPFVVLIVVFYFFLIRPQRKRDKQERDMRNSIAIGDEISTIGGFIGRVVNIKDDVLVIESSSDRTKLKIYRWVRRLRRPRRSRRPRKQRRTQSNNPISCRIA